MEAKEFQANELKKTCANCDYYVAGFCIAYKKVNIVFPNGTCNKFKARK